MISTQLSESLQQGIVAARAGHRLLARLHLSRAAEAEPSNDACWVWMAWVAESPEAAVRHLEQALACNSNNEIARAGLTWAKVMQEWDFRHPLGARETLAAVARYETVLPPAAPSHSSVDASPLAEASSALVEASSALIDASSAIVEVSAAHHESPPALLEASSAIVEATSALVTASSALAELSDSDVHVAHHETPAVAEHHEEVSDHSERHETPAVHADHHEAVAERLIDVEPNQPASLNAIEDPTSQDLPAVSAAATFVDVHEEKPLASPVGELIPLSTPTFGEDDIFAGFGETFHPEDFVGFKTEEVPFKIRKPNDTAVSMPFKGGFMAGVFGGAEKAPSPADALAPATNPSWAPPAVRSRIASDSDSVHGDLHAVQAATEAISQPVQDVIDEFRARNTAAENKPEASFRAVEATSLDLGSHAAAAQAADPSALAAAVQPHTTSAKSSSTAADVPLAHQSADFIDIEALVKTPKQPPATLEAEAPAPEPPAWVESQPDVKRNILVVDDSPTVCKIVSITLKKRGYNVTTAGDGVEAMSIIATAQPDLILLDITMPRMDGYQLCKLIKGYPATKHIPVVMLSGKDGFFDRVRGKLVGCADYVTKPFDPEALVQVIERFLPVGVA